MSSTPKNLLTNGQTLSDSHKMLPTNESPRKRTAWDTELGQLLSDLTRIQTETLASLNKRRQLIIDADFEGLSALGNREKQLMEELQQCVVRREDLLQRAAEEGLPSNSIESLAAALPRRQRGDMPKQVKIAAGQARLLQHHSLTNWVVVQRNLMHLSQLLEIIATGGRLQPTYGNGELADVTGSLVNKEG